MTEANHIEMNPLYYGDNLDILRSFVADESAAQTPVFEYP